MTDSEYGNYLALLANAPAQAESLLHSQEQAAGSIGLCVNENKTESICMKKKESSSHKVELFNQFT